MERAAVERAAVERKGVERAVVEREGVQRVVGPNEVLVPVHKGTVAELLVANALIVRSAGRLKVFRPWPDDHGVDFRLAARGDPASLELQVKSAFARPEGNASRFIIDLTDIPARRRQYRVLACGVDEQAGGLRPQAWWIPGSAFPRASAARRTFRWSPPASSRRGSKWDRYRIEIDQLGPVAEKTLEGLGAVRRGSRGATKGLGPFTRGFVSENAVIVAAALGSQGRLCAFRPVADVVGIDLVFQAIDGRVGVAAQVKGDFVTADGEAVASFIDARTFRARDDRLLVVAPYLPAQLRLAKTAWVMTTNEFARRAARRPGGLEFYGSPREGAKDKFAPFRCPSDRLAGVLERCIAARSRDGPSARLPTGRLGTAKRAAPRARPRA